MVMVRLIMGFLPIDRKKTHIFHPIWASSSIYQPATGVIVSVLRPFTLRLAMYLLEIFHLKSCQDQPRWSVVMTIDSLICHIYISESDIWIFVITDFLANDNNQFPQCPLLAPIIRTQETHLQISFQGTYQKMRKHYNKVTESNRDEICLSRHVKNFLAQQIFTVT